MAEIMTVEEVAAYLRVTERTVYRLLDRGGFPASRVGRQWRFDKSLIDKWIKENSVGVKPNILVIDDEEVVHLLFMRSLEALGYTVVAVGTSLEGLELAKQQDFDLVFLDLKMPGMNGAELLGHLRKVKPELPVTIITGYPNSDMMSRALTHGPFGIMNKPFNESDILTAIKVFLRFIKQKSC